MRWVAALCLAASLVGCSRGPHGLGKGACPYLRPRLIRLDNARVSGSEHDITAVAQDIGLYVKGLPAGGKAKSDRKLVTFSQALTVFSTTGSTSALDPAEGAIKRMCNVA